MSATRKKLIEVALPLAAINEESAREKSIRHGHPSTLHLWWARRPLASARAVIFAQLVDDPASVPEEFPTPQEQVRERKRLFRLIEQLVAWENSANERLLDDARAAIRRSWARACLGAAAVAAMRDDEIAARMADGTIPPLPPFHDPFAGGGSLPLEAQRLGLVAWAGDLNPVAVLINKAMIEIPPRFAGLPPVNPAARADPRLFAREWRGAQGLAEDVRRYGQWMRDEAEKRIGHLYPRIAITPDLAADRPDLQPLIGQRLTVIAWLWARTVKSPNPAFARVDAPLATTFVLSSKPGKEAYVEPIVDGSAYAFTVRGAGAPGFDRAAYERAKHGTKLARGANFQCVLSGAPITGEYIKAEGRAGRMGARLMAIVAEGPRGRLYLPPTPEHEAIARSAQPEWAPDTPLHGKARDQMPLYGMETFADLFTPRQLVALTAFADLVGEAIERVKRDALAAGMSADPTPLRDGGCGATAYAEAVGVYLAFAVDKVADRGCSIGRWDPTPTQSGIINAFSRQALPMTWDFAESNPLGAASGNFVGAVDLVAKSLLCLAAIPAGQATQADAQAQAPVCDAIISTDPPYYDNIGYADLSDFFYVWLRRVLKPVFPDLFATVAVPKAEELAATPYRHDGKQAAERFFVEGMTRVLRNLAAQTHPAFPVTIYYAYKQRETLGDLGARASSPDLAGETPAQPEMPALPGISSTGWETFLEAVIRAGFAITGTWPMRTELGNRQNAMETNALASSIVLVCRPRPASAPIAARREFMTALKTELPRALADLQRASIAPTDFAQAAIGLGMAVFSRFAAVRDATGRDMSVREALALINQALDETLAEQEGEFDAATRWALAWFEQHGFAEGDFGVAETLSKAKNTSVEAMVGAGIVESKRGKVRLLLPKEAAAASSRPSLAEGGGNGTRRGDGEAGPVWAATHRLIYALDTGGEQAAAALVAQLGSRADGVRELAYRLYAICERKRRSAEALAYNGLVQSWSEVVRLAAETSAARSEQTTFLN